jgi:hypothetical protein
MFYGMTICEKIRVLGLSTECKIGYEMAYAYRKIISAG